MIALRGHDRNRYQHVSHGHYDKAPLNSAFVILLVVSYQSSDKAEHVDCRIENRIDDSGCSLVQAELGAEKEEKNGVHNIVAKTLSHIT